ncbi:MAG: hypothetical protein HZB15_11960 [Actinobacteria bacterium]|nr:hypothetical protein [Actinomycetota bacterium]
MDNEDRIRELEQKVHALGTTRRRRGWRSRWAAIGAAVAVTLGGGTALHYASAAPGDVVTNSFVPVAPVRILDTRPAPENVGGFTGPLATGQTHSFQVTGVAGVPANATAVVMNMTVTATTGSSFLTVYPAGATRPTASNLNWAAGTTIPNLVTVKIGAGGQVSIFNLSGEAHVIADVAGYYIPGNDKFISLDIFGTDDSSALFDGGFGPNAGLVFPDAALSTANFHIVLPPDYTAGTALVGTFTWHTTSINCAVSWRPNYSSVSRAGQVHAPNPGVTSGLTGPGDSANGATANVVQSATFTLTSPDNGFTLQPGDSYTFGLYRNGTNGTDTCASDARIDSIVIRYE